MSHPEDFCDQCGRPNIVWSVDSDRWNLAVSDRAKVLCPVCFVEAWEAATGMQAIWELVPTHIGVPQSDTRPPPAPDRFYRSKGDPK